MSKNSDAQFKVPAACETTIEGNVKLSTDVIVPFVVSTEKIDGDKAGEIIQRDLSLNENSDAQLNEPASCETRIEENFKPSTDGIVPLVVCTEEIDALLPDRSREKRDGCNFNEDSVGQSNTLLHSTYDGKILENTAVVVVPHAGGTDALQSEKLEEKLRSVFKLKDYPEIHLKQPSIVGETYEPKNLKHCIDVTDPNKSNLVERNTSSSIEPREKLEYCPNLNEPLATPRDQMSPICQVNDRKNPEHDAGAIEPILTTITSASNKSGKEIDSGYCRNVRADTDFNDLSMACETHEREKVNSNVIMIEHAKPDDREVNNLSSDPSEEKLVCFTDMNKPSDIIVDELPDNCEGHNENDSNQNDDVETEIETTEANTVFSHKFEAKLYPVASLTDSSNARIDEHPFNCTINSEKHKKHKTDLVRCSQINTGKTKTLVSDISGEHFDHGSNVSVPLKNNAVSVIVYSKFQTRDKNAFFSNQ